jgi:glycosyltransferase involved in cell wall biosynthesis
MRKILIFTDFNRELKLAEPDIGPDAASGVAAFEAFGFAGEFVNHYGLPWNPLAGSHAIWRGIDPARAVWAMTRRRDAAAVVSLGESGALVLLALRRLHRIPVVVMHDSDHQDWRPRKAIQDLVLPQADLVLVQTHMQASYLTERYKLRRPPVLVGPRIDEAFFRPMGDGSGDYVFAIGNDAARDYSLLLRAVSALDLPLRILTRMPITLDGSEHCHVEVIDRRVTYREMRALYAGARLVALPLRERISPGGMTSLLEAMAMGKPVIITASSGVVEIVDPGHSGMVVPHDDPVAFRKALVELWNDPARCRAMGTAARARIDACYSTRLRAARLCEAVRGLREEMRLEP